MARLGKQPEKDLISNQQQKGFTTQATELLVQIKFFSITVIFNIILH